jgi:hypothetical protein
MVADFHYRYRILETKLIDIERQKVLSEIYSQCSMMPQNDRPDKNDEENGEQAPTVKQMGVNKMNHPPARMRPCLKKETSHQLPTQA